MYFLKSFHVFLVASYVQTNGDYGFCFWSYLFIYFKKNAFILFGFTLNCCARVWRRRRRGEARRGETGLTVYSPLELISLVFSTSRGWHRKVAQPPCGETAPSRHVTSKEEQLLAAETGRLLTAMKLDRKCVNMLSPMTPVPRTSCLAWS